ncbi:hypothetical protein HELRODRAFT_179300 [Helobdella robusta]|uniref:Cadherin domain-containing protein n=1 Tax=Helobdella robusta TaxID=6412 RepID=T1FEI3_HELRO|nr:hypothetical protein HELRODRAFT_179300 [Helobdella robusta]ESN95525.1 hypothetical protein HELRODRAFT_179300 [Helobdella robusta]
MYLKLQIHSFGRSANSGDTVGRWHVTATDIDSVTNSQLTYSVSDSTFSVQTLNNIGYVKTAKRLDYDRIPDHTYNFTIVATDNGDPPHKGSAAVRVSVTNVNDEDPVFVKDVERVQLSEDAPMRTVVHVVQAFDPDGDGVTYTFAG